MLLAWEPGEALSWLFSSRRKALTLLEYHQLVFRCLTFELSGRRRQDARPGLAKMYRVPPDRAWWRAVGAPLERGVRAHWATLELVELPLQAFALRAPISCCTTMKPRTRTSASLLNQDLIAHLRQNLQIGRAMNKSQSFVLECPQVRWCVQSCFVVRSASLPLPIYFDAAG